MPENPVSPNKHLCIALALIIGVLVGGILAIILEVMDNTFRDRKQVEELLNIPVLGNIPCINLKEV